MTRPVQLALVQFAPTKGDYAGTLAHLTEAFEAVAALTPRPDVVTLPETALTGYFLEGGVRDVARSADAFAHDLNAAWRAAARDGGTVDVVAGFYEIRHDTYYNSVLYATLGGTAPEIVHVHRKVFLPTYALFDEERFVDRGFEIQAFDTAWGRAAMLICEDAWHGITATAAALDGAQVLFVPSASPARGAWPQPEEPAAAPANLHRWTRVARDRAEEHGLYVVVTQLVGGEGGKMFAGGSVVTGPRGDIRTQGPLWEEGVLPVTLDLRDIARVRADAPLLSDLQVVLPHMLSALRRTATDASWPAVPTE